MTGAPVIAVAGAGGSLGPDVVGALKASGATVAGADRDPGLCAGQSLDDVRGVDLLDPGDAAAWARDLEERFGRVDGLVHLVGGWRGGDPIDEAPLEDYTWLHDLLVVTLQHATRAFLPALRRSGRGRIVVVSSTQAQAPGHTNAAYATAKAAAETWTLACGDALAPHGGTANVVVVNAIVTPAMRAESPGESFATFTDTADIAAAITWLCSDGAARVNRHRLPVLP